MKLNDAIKRIKHCHKNGYPVAINFNGEQYLIEFEEEEKQVRT